MNQFTEIFDMHLLRLGFGSAEIEFTFGGEKVTMEFDEYLNDPFPNFVRLALMLRQGRDFAFRCVDFLDDDGGIYLYARYAGPDLVAMAVDVGKKGVKHHGEGHRFYVKQTPARLLAVLQGLFDELLACEAFPYMYPCHCMLDEDLYDRLAAEAEEEARQLTEEEKYKLFVRKLRENIALQEDAESFYEQYRRMLADGSVPGGLRASDIIRLG